MAPLFQFITMAFPKAGIQLASLPFTLNMLFFGLALILSVRQLSRFLSSMPLFAFSYTMLIVFVFFSVLLNIAYGTITTMKIAMTAVVTLSPLAGMIMFSIKTETAFRITAVSSVLAGGYMVVQKLFGIIATSIAGVTYTLIHS